MESDLQAIIDAYRDGDVEAQEKLLAQVQRTCGVNDLYVGDLS